MDQIGKIIEDHLIIRGIGINFFQQTIKFPEIFLIYRLKGIPVYFIIHYTKHINQIIRLNVSAGKRNCLVRNGKSITHAAVGGIGNYLNRSCIGLDIFKSEDCGQLRANLSRGKIFELKLKTSGNNGNRNILRIRGRQNEFHILRRFLKCLEKSIKTCF